MEMVVGGEGGEEAIFVDTAADEFGSCSAPLKQVTDPVVYKLVRVDFDGRLVPATDDELMEVENLLELEKSDLLSVSDVVDTVGQGLDKDDTSEKTSQEFKGSSQTKNAEVDEEKLNAQLEEVLPMSSLNPNNAQTDESRNDVVEPNLKVGLSKIGSAGCKPNFSLLKGEINLDKLTIRELQETFRATFGRETSVKDKLWLKRRIAMGLTNSCDICVTNFIINDGQFVGEKEETCKNLDREDPIGGEVCCEGDGIPAASQKVMEDTVDGSELRNYLSESGHGSDDMLEQRGAKRVRKPTKRYIEELSDKETRECNKKRMPSTKRLEQHKASSGSLVRTGWGAHAGAIVTRPDSIGGSGIRVPYVSRVRRCRPRKSVVALTNFQPSEEALMRKITECSKPQPCSLGGDKVVEPKAALIQEPLAPEEEKENHCVTGMSEFSQDQELTDKDSRGNILLDCIADINSDDKASTVPTMKGGMRRKHHRAWTLTEVVKLVDGVSKFGAGRWSEIKRLSFSSHSYRTSVDLKDKWRNLLKASFASPPSDKGMNPRKNAPSPIPAPILMKVRELAEINGQVHRILKATSETEDNSGSSVNENNRSGYL